MAMLGRNSTADLNNIQVLKPYAVRVIDDDEIVLNASTSAVGEIRSDLVATEFSQAPGSVGGTMKVRVKDYLWLKGDRSENEIERWENKTITLEMRDNAANRALQRVLFRGKVAAVENTYTPDDNSVSLIVADPWFQAADAPVDMPTNGLTVGEIMRSFERGFYYQTRVRDGAVQRVTKFFPQFLFPTTRDGTPLAEIDPVLLESGRYAGNVSLSGQSFAEGFCDVIEAAYGGRLIPDVDYGARAKVIFTARTRGATERDVIVGSPGTDRYTERRMCQVKSITGQYDFRTIRNRVYGEGAPERIIEPVVLEKGWSDAEETLVKATPALMHTPAYYHVFRRFRAPEAFWSATGQTWGGGSNGRQDQLIFWQTASVPAEGVAEGPVQVSPAYEIRRERTTGDTDGVVIDNLRELAAEDAKTLSIFFTEPQVFEYYTTAQRAAMALNLPGGNPSIAPYTYEMEAVLVGEPVQVDTGIRGAEYMSRMRTAFIRNQNIIKHTHRGHYSGTGASRTVVEESEWEVRDDTPLFRSQAEEIVDRLATGTADLAVTLWKLDFSWKMGDRIKRVLSNARRVLLSDLDWYVESLSHDLQTGNTTLNLSRNAGSYIGGAF